MGDYMNNRLTNQLCDIEGIGKRWGWFLTIGLLLIIMGCIVISSAVYATLFSVIFLGCFLCAAGVAQVVHAFIEKKWSGCFLALGLGLLYGVSGFVCIAHPAGSAITITLWIAAMCFFVGLFRMISSLISRFDQWGWVFFNGLITFCLGLMIFADWPISGMWVIGLFVGIDMLLAGWSSVLIGFSVKKLCSR